jgi:hypothetical protein
LRDAVGSREVADFAGACRAAGLRAAGLRAAGAARGLLGDRARGFDFGRDTVKGPTTSRICPSQNVPS